MIILAKPTLNSLFNRIQHITIGPLICKLIRHSHSKYPLRARTKGGRYAAQEPE